MTGVVFTVCRLLDMQQIVPSVSLFLGDLAGIIYARNISEHCSCLSCVGGGREFRHICLEKLAKLKPELSAWLDAAGGTVSEKESF